MPGIKVPDPDSYTFEFYSAAWEIIGEHLTEAIQDFFAIGRLLK